ncbi:MAG TPA: hypothetical protein V6D48_19605 [Oculatellaceae cyanobacterium]
MTTLLNKPRSPLNIMRREHKELLDQLAPEAPTRVRTCAIKLIPYFEHWHSWKKSLYPSHWIYQPLADIRHDLMDAHTVHVIREAIALLQRLGFLSVRRNDRATNCRNGQDRTHQYLLHSDRIEASLKQLFNEPTAETLKTSPFVNIETPSFNSETPSFNSETPDFTVDKYTQIPSIDSFKNSCSLQQEREKLEFLPKEEEEVDSQEEGVVPVSFAPPQDLINVLQQNKDSGLDKCSASLQLKKTQNDLPTPEGWDEFYPQLLEYARREGKSSPAGWTSTTSRHILQELAAGRPHCLWADFQNGLPLGASEFDGQREWLNPETQEPWPYFKEALTDHFQRKDAGRTKEVKSRFDVAGEVAATLAQPKKAAAYWAELKNQIIFYRERWERDRKLGISQPYLPPHFSDCTEPTLQEAAQAMGEFKGDANLLAPAAVNSLPPTQADDLPLLPTQPAQEACLPLEEKDLPAAAEPVPAVVEEKPSVMELQARINSRLLAPFAKILIKANPQWGYVVVEGLVLVVGEVPSPEYLRSLLTNPITAPKVRRLIEANPSWGFSLDQEGQLWEF